MAVALELVALAPVLAHAGHWIESVTMAVPIAAFGVWLAVTQLRERRNRR